ncbi:type I polyketide synthase [Streptomyces nigrescens]|uniref:Polyketide synthase dehydratase domain-containing protein n=1 Tax=Streptomyces nigrescens TaxID=1920 RepID=A0ABY7IWB7_STRNI|nr:type I polyketide synthase [Streptomyces nigrescens]WAU03114.1 polyketide synthase dehydratase domain-containing protein [Streptomyces nigrescens]
MSETRARRAGPRPTDAAIVGMGALFPGAEDLAAYWRNLVAGTDCITDVPPGRWDPEIYYDPQGAQGPARSDRFYCRRGGFLDDPAAFDPTRFGIMPAAVRGAEPDQLLALRTIADAIADAGGEERLPADRSRIGVILGRGGFMGVATARLDQRVRTAHQLAATLRELAPELGESRIAAAREAFQAGLGPEQPEASIGLVPSFTAARTANRLDFRGPAYTLDAACASSLLAVAQAVDLLAAGRCDLVVAGAVHHCHIATLWSVFTQLRALSPTQHIRPFDRRADGTLLSEGTGVVLLKRLADAERDGDRVYAVVRGTGVAGDGRAAGLMSPRAEGQIDALEQAWAAAGLDPADPTALGLLEAHGTGTPVGDGVELDTLARVFGPPGAGVPPVGLGSVKSMLGHTMQAAGIAGLIKAALAVHHRTLPPTLHLDEPHEGLARTRMRPVTVAEPWDAGRAPLRAGVNAFGFGGINAHTVLEEAPGRRSPAAPPPQRAASHRTASHRTAPHRTSPHAPSPLRTAEPERTVLLAADTPAQLADQLREMGDFGAATGTGAPVPAPAPAPDGPCRLALPDPTPQRRALAAKILARALPWRGRGEVWFTPSPLFGPYAPQEGARLAFLFPGLEAEPPPSVDDIADQMALPRPTVSGGSGLVERAVDTLATGRLLARALDELGLAPDLLTGHSLGEWTAMVVAGMYPPQAVDAFLDSLRPGSLAVPDLVYAALGCGAPQAAAALAGLERIAVSHDNCPHQSVICGAPQPLAEAVRRLAGQGVRAQEMPFRSGFHTPMWAPYLHQTGTAFDALPLRDQRLPVWSATTAAPFPDDPSAIRRLVLRHLLEPVRFQELTRRLYETGVRAFVQLGAGSLPGFVSDTLHGQDHLAITAADSRRDGPAQLRRLAAALWTEGLSPRWERLAPASGSALVRGSASVRGAAPVGGSVSVRGPAPVGGSAWAHGSAPAADRGTDCAADRAMDGAADCGTARAGARATARAAVPEGARAAIRLDLGSPLVRLGVGTPGRPLLAPADPPPPPTPPPAPEGGGGGGGGGALPHPRPAAAEPVQQALDAVLAETRAATRTVAAAVAAAPAPSAAAPAGPHTTAAPHPAAGAPSTAVAPRTAAAPVIAHTAPTSPSAPASAAVVGPRTSSAPRPTATTPSTLTTSPTPRHTIRRLSLATLPYVRDHCVYLQPDDWPEAADRFPVVPMTTLLELAAEAAREAQPGYLVTGYSDVRALRWLAVAPPVDVAVSATPEGDGRVRVSLGDFAAVTVHLAARHPAPPRPDPADLTSGRPAPVSAQALYRDRWMFHGPAFAGVHEVSTLAADGIRGTLRALPAPGALLDAAGQLLGHWMQLKLSGDRLVFPATLDRVRLYGPPPREGALLAATARIREVRAGSVRGEVELCGADGGVWARLEGWTYRRFGADERVWPMKFTPEVCGIGEPRPGGWCLARRRWSDPASQELVMRRYLGAGERARYERCAPRARAAWLLGRIAAKDAVRELLWESGAGPVFPAEIQVGTDDQGRPCPEGPLAHGLHLSLAHKDRIAVALAHRSGPVGIDIERVTDDPPALERFALTPAERRLADDLRARHAPGTTGRAYWLTALWCAKEAAAKAAGSGLDGRPLDWAVTPAPGGALWVVSPDGRPHLVHLDSVDDLSGRHVVAWTGPRPADRTGTDTLTPTEATHGS